MNGMMNINLLWVVTLSNEHDSFEYNRFQGHRLDNPDRARFIALRNPGYDVRIENALDPRDYYTHDAVYLQLIRSPE